MVIFDKSQISVDLILYFKSKYIICKGAWNSGGLTLFLDSFVFDIIDKKTPLLKRYINLQKWITG